MTTARNMTPIENRIEELKKTCPVWETHVSELETLVLETNARAEKAEAENARLLEALREIASQEGEWHFGGVPHPLCVIAEKAIQKV